jgi:3-oxoacyl-[acyl-carrier-protein] synthase III
VGGGLPKNIVYNLEEFGNTASTTHFVALHRFLDEGRLEEDDRIMLISFASGIVIGALVFTLGDLGQGNALRH